MVNVIFEALKKELTANEYLKPEKVIKLFHKYADCSSTTKSADYLFSDNIYCKLGNDKIGTDTLIINLSTAINCYCRKKGICKNKDCYACSQEKQYKDYLLCNMVNEYLFHRMGSVELIKSIENQFKQEFTAGKIKYIRFNEAGEFDGIKSFKKADEIAKYFKNKYGVISYSYSHNRRMYYKYKKDIENSDIVLSWSFKNKENRKSTIIINPNTLFEYLDNSEYVICSGNCLNCPYCKNKKDKRPILFLRHVNKGINKQLMELLDLKEYQELINQKNKDYAKFILELED